MENSRTSLGHKYVCFSLVDRLLLQGQGALQTLTNRIRVTLRPATLRQCVTARRVIVLLIVIASCFVHYWRLSVTPRWYGDECNHALWARNISNGDWTIGGQPNTNFRDGFSYAFHLLCNVSFWIFGKGLLAVRVVTATSAVLCTLLLYWTLKELGFSYGAFLGAMAWNAHTLSINFSRWGFSHGVAGTLILASLFLLIKHSNCKKRSYLYGAAFSAGSAVTMTYWTVPILPVMAVVLLYRHGRRGLLPMGVLVLPMACLVILAVAIWGFDDVRQDILRLASGSHMDAAAQSGRTLGYLLNHVFRSYINLLSVDIYVALGAIGILLLRRRWQILLAVAMLLSLSILPVLSAGEILSTFFYRAMTFCPILFVGFGAIWERAAEVMYHLLAGSTLKLAGALYAAVFGTATCILFYAYCCRMHENTIGIDTPIDLFCAERCDDTKAAAAFLNTRRLPDGFVIASPIVAHAVERQAVIPKDVVNFLNLGVPTRKQKHRYIHDLSLARAAFFVVDNLFYAHTLRYTPGGLEFAWMIENQKWPLVWQKGEYRIYQNPNKCNSKIASPTYYAIDRPNFYKRLATKEMRGKNYKEAVSCLSKSLIHSPQDIEAMNILAIAHARLSEFAKAVAWLDRAIEISPAYEIAHRNRKAIMQDLIAVKKRRMTP